MHTMNHIENTVHSNERRSTRKEFKFFQYLGKARQPENGLQLRDVYAYGEKNGHEYVVMEAYENSLFDSRPEISTYPLETIVKIVMRVLNTLQWIHSYGIFLATPWEEIILEGVGNGDNRTTLCNLDWAVCLSTMIDRSDVGILNVAQSICYNQLLDGTGDYTDRLRNLYIDDLYSDCVLAVEMLGMELTEEVEEELIAKRELASTGQKVEKVLVVLAAVAGSLKYVGGLQEREYPDFITSYSVMKILFETDYEELGSSEMDNTNLDLTTKINR